LAGEQGFSLVEVLVTLALVGLLSALAVLNFNRSGLSLVDATETLAGNIRLARANAVSRGARYRVTLHSNSYSLQRLQDDDGDDVWEPDAAFPTQEVELSGGITISEGASVEIEFTTRGLLASLPDGIPADVIPISLSSADESQSEAIEVWPSGQVQRL
jgi:general secretion pathway protein H